MRRVRLSVSLCPPASGLHAWCHGRSVEVPTPETCLRRSMRALCLHHTYSGMHRSCTICCCASSISGASCRWVEGVNAIA